MSELERALVALGRDLELPPTPDLAAAVRTRLARRRRRWLVPALATLLAVAVALAVPPARSAILRFFHLRGAEVTIVDRLPPVQRAPVSLGTPTTLAALPFRPLLPVGEQPLAVYLADGGAWLRYRGLLLYEFPSGSASFLKKVAAGDAKVEYVDVGGDPGIWIGAGRHVVYLPGGSVRLAGRTLLWQHGPLTLRLEADVSKVRAIALASRIR
jgi:hypothetical protein